MKNLLIILLASCSFPLWSQCPTCNPDLTCTSVDGSPTVCPLELPAAFTGEYYEEALTFYMPSVVTDPEFGITVDLVEVTITSVSGLPFGLSYSTNNANGVYYPSNGENHGCATLCGTALIPGIYDVSINVDIIASVGGFEITDSRSFNYALLVEQGSVSTESFTYSTPAGCGETIVEFEATLSGTSSQLTTYNWSFGNGSNSVEENPSAVFSAPGTYDVSLTTSIYNYILSNVDLDNINGAGNGDVDEFFSPPADPYFTLQDAQNSVIFTSSTVDNTINPTWSDLNIILDNPPYTLSFWDEDDASADDLLSTFSINLSPGTTPFNSGDGTVGSLTVALSPSGELTNSVTINVFSLPDATISAFGSTLGVAEFGASSYQWYFNEIPIQGANAPTYNAQQLGFYSCLVINAQGCEAMSDPYLFCGSLLPVFDPLANEVYVEPNFDTYQWYFNGIEVDGATTFYLVNPLPGNYSVYVTNEIGCSFQSNVVVVPFVGVQKIYENKTNLFPNPSRGLFCVVAETNIEQVRVLNSLGSAVLIEHPFSNKWQNDMPLSVGIYFVEIKTNKGMHLLKAVVE